MAEQNAPVANGADNQPVAQFAIQKIYLKDSSFEVPGAPAIFQDNGQPQVQLNLTQKAVQLGDNVFEVVLTVTLTCKIGEKSAYLAEVQQAGVFALAGFDAPTQHAMLGAYCPNVLFPYARATVASLITDGGFPPFILQPINFDQLYAESMRRQNDQVVEATN